MKTEKGRPFNYVKTYCIKIIINKYERGKGPTIYCRNALFCSNYHNYEQGKWQAP